MMISAPPPPDIVFDGNSYDYSVPAAVARYELHRNANSGANAIAKNNRY